MDFGCFYFLLFVLSSIHAFPHGSGMYEKLNKEKRIRGGTDINISEAKYYVLITCGNTLCGGTLVRRNKVLTAGHCVIDCQRTSFRIAVGLNSLSQYGQARKYAASAINIHPSYNRTNPYPYDVAVVTLSQNVELNNNVATIPYATTRPPVGRYLTIVGYGNLDTNGRRAERLQRARGKIVDYQNTLIFTNATGPSVLSGDSGGPAVYGNQLSGITSAYMYSGGRIIRNLFVAVAHPDILSFIRRYAA